MNVPVEHTSESNKDPRLSLRPEVPTDPSAESMAELFQNDTLRPILKMQNDLILQIYKHFLIKRKVKFEGMSVPQRSNWIANSVSKDNRLRGLLLGMVIGQFTKQELDKFIEMESEIRRRMTNLLVQRIQSQMKTLL